MKIANRLSRDVVILMALAGASIIVYLIFAGSIHRLGFPLDDAWIHQTYARNLVRYGEWVYFPNQPSAGSTSPLWTVLLAVGYVFKLKPLFWAYFLGWVCLWMLALFGMQVFQRLTREGWKSCLIAGGVFVFEWHLVWAALSGMETILLACLIILTFLLLLRTDRSWLLLGVLTGLSVWVRPDGITLLGPVLFIALGSKTGYREKISSLLAVAGGFLLLFIPYLIFNQIVAGAIWPNTYFAKQAEYAQLMSEPYLKRLFELIQPPLVGAGVLLIPGFFYEIWRSVKHRKLIEISAALWLCGYLGVYAARLPVTYQHGRYMMPAIPVYFLLGMVGIAELKSAYTEKINNINAETQRRKENQMDRIWSVASRTWMISVVSILIGFWLLGARAYGRDVAVIETEMVATAEWVNLHLEKNTVVAAHDIGALGYFSSHRILDLAGLISPEVIPIIRDEARLIEFLNAHRVDYLITFPGWYPDLIQHAIPVYTSSGDFSPALGGENMVVYRWQAIR